MRPAVIAGARPNFPKVAPLIRAMDAAGLDPCLVHTGQHYDWIMSASFFEDLALPDPVANLAIGSGSQAVQTARTMLAFDEWLDSSPVDCVVTVGDVNSTLACALVAAKREIPVAHVEAGLRSFDLRMPEEWNRVLTDRLSAWLFTPSSDADANLLAEGIPEARIFRVGNIMVDSLLESLSKALESPVRHRLGIPEPYGLVTLHRPGLVDDRERLTEVMTAMRKVASDLPLVFPIHPRTRANLGRFGVSDSGDDLLLTEPLGYLDFLCLEANARLVMTDSGGVQEETTVLGVPCLTLRENTERPVTITDGSNQLVGLDGSAIVEGARQALASERAPKCPPLWDGRTSSRIVEVLTGTTSSKVSQDLAEVRAGAAR